MKRKVMLLTLTLALVLGIAQIASATGWGMGGGRLGGSKAGGPPALSSENWISPVERLNLSNEQAQQLKELHKSNYEATKELRAKLQDAMFELRQMGFEKNPDKAAVDAKIKEISDLRDQMYQIKQQNWQNVQSILTPEQQSLMKNMRGYGRHGGWGMGCF
ncbi:MAG: Spy/CpxP family protein refolding chaperone [Peptococcaceae bacterium]|nr:Spy/CpxP family protein refolding chaperone [Peptococcaceae bacterium]